MNDDTTYINNQEDYWNILTNINEWIKFSDQKSVFVITTYSVILTIIYTNASEIYDAISNSKLLIWSTVITSFFSAISIFFSFKCLSPRLKNNNTSSIFFFGHISNNTNYEEYYTYSKSILQDKESIEKSIAEQIYTNSKIATTKFKNVTYSIRAQVLSLLTIGLSLIIYLI